MTTIEQSAPLSDASPAVQLLLDQAAITHLVHRVARAMDTRDWALLSDCFTPDLAGDFANGDAAGREAAMTQYRDFLQPLAVTQHLVGNVEPTVDGDTASAHSTFQAQHLRKTDGTGQYLLGGVYDDELTRTTSGWRIHRRRVRGLWSAGDATVFVRPLTRSSS